MPKRKIFVTGAGRGLGLALARNLAAQGHRVFAGVHQWTEGYDPGGGIVPLDLDVSDLGSVEDCFRRVASQTDHLDWVVNNAAVLGDLDQGASGALDYESMVRAFQVNTLGPLRVSQTFWPLLESGATKLIVNISSEAGSIAGCGRDGWFGYGMSKAALNMQSAQFHNAIRPRGGRVLVVHPGWIRTTMRGSVDEAAPLSPEEAAEAVVGVILSHGGRSEPRPLFVQWDGRLLPW